MSKLPADCNRTEDKPEVAGAARLARRDLLVIAGQTACAMVLSACEGKESQGSSDMGTSDMRGKSSDMRGVMDMRPEPDLMPGPDMAYVCMPMVATGAETLPVDEAKSFYNNAYPAKSFIVARDAKGFYAIRNVCSHAGCQTGYNAAAKTYDCPCHGSRYNFDGTVMMGPAGEALMRYPMTKRGDGMLVVDPCGSATTDLSGRVT